MVTKRAPKKAAAEPEVKGPDPKVWGSDKNRPSSEAVIEGVQLVGDSGDDGKPVKGPDPRQWGKR